MDVRPRVFPRTRTVRRGSILNEIGGRGGTCSRPHHQQISQSASILLLLLFQADLLRQQSSLSLPHHIKCTVLVMDILVYFLVQFHIFLRVAPCICYMQYLVRSTPLHPLSPIVR